MTYLEQKRAQAQRIYQEEQKYWADHADEFKKSVDGALVDGKIKLICVAG
jgi:hypothetical protein